MRRKIGRRAVVAGAAAALCAPSVTLARQETWRMVGMDEFPPYNYQADGRFVGIDIDILTEAAGRMGVAMDFVALPWRRVLLALELGEADALFQLAPTPRRLHDWLMVPLRPTRLVYAVRAESTLTDVAALDGLAGLSVGVVDGFTYTPAFNEAVSFLHEGSIDDQTSLRKLLLGRADIIVGGEANLRFAMQKFGLGERVRILPTPLDEQDRFVGLSRTAAGHEKAARLSRAIAAMRSEGRIDAFLGQTTP